ncbi:MAG: pullulanase [Rhodobacteraceae bacterium]|nr:pullulanase [Paracoccaceae bacterium]
MAPSDPRKDQPERGDKIPPVLLRAMLVLVVSVLLIVTYARVTDRPLSALPDQDAPIAVERDIVLNGSMSGAATVYDTEGNVIAEFGPDEGGFIAGVWRVLQRERNKTGAQLDAPIRLIRYESGRLSLRDELTGWRAELIGFGADNEAVFARLLDEEG